jgi:hypothetical protein
MIVRPRWLVALVVASCARESMTARVGEPEGSLDPAPASAVASATAAASSPPLAPPAPQQIDPDGDDDPGPMAQGPLPVRAHFEKVGKPPVALRMICDLTPLGDALYAAHSVQPLGQDGAIISRYRPREPPKTAFKVAFDWNRPGEPAKGGGAGQGFVRVHLIGGRLFVPDADPPYNGFGISEFGTEGFVFVSSPAGEFASPRRPGHRPPVPPSLEGRPGAGVLPRAYHVIDVIRYRGRLYASTGSVPPKQAAWRGPSPGALHVANADWSRWTYEIDYPYPWQNGVWRLTFLVRYRDRLYAGIQDYDGREPNDYVYFDPPPAANAIGRDDVHPTRVTDRGGAQTLRWYTDRGRLFWIAWARDGVWLRVTRDGDHWTPIGLPPGVGAPTDIVRFRGALVVLTERALVALGDDATVRVIATVSDKHSPFELRDSFCAAPLAVFDGELYAGGQRDGSLYRLVADEPGAGR